MLPLLDFCQRHNFAPPWYTPIEQYYRRYCAGSDSLVTYAAINLYRLIDSSTGEPLSCRLYLYLGLLYHTPAMSLKTVFSVTNVESTYVELP